MFVVAGPREKFSETEINHMKKFLEEGGAILVLLGEGGEKSYSYYLLGTLQVNNNVAHWDQIQVWKGKYTLGSTT